MRAVRVGIGTPDHRRRSIPRITFRENMKTRRRIYLRASDSPSKTQVQLSESASLWPRIVGDSGHDPVAALKVTMSEIASPSSLLELTAEIIAAHAGHNHVAADALVAMIGSVYGALAAVGSGPAPTPAKPQPAVAVKKSVFPDHIVCLEDGKKLKMLRRHLATSYGLTPAQYREKWGLPSDYPMVAPAYAEKRSTLAKQIGLGRKPAARPAPEAATAVPARRGRPAKAAATE
jgi:predicted transcriptional regulator